MFVSIPATGIRLMTLATGFMKIDAVPSWNRKFHSVLGYDPRILTKLQCVPSNWMALATLAS